MWRRFAAFLFSVVTVFCFEVFVGQNSKVKVAILQYKNTLLQIEGI